MLTADGQIVVQSGIEVFKQGKNFSSGTADLVVLTADGQIVVQSGIEL